MTIEWSQKEGRVQQIGMVNGVHLYTVTSSYAHGDLAKTHPWGLKTLLPFAVNRIFQTPEAAKEHAERHLEAAMLHLGFIRRDVA